MFENFSIQSKKIIQELKIIKEEYKIKTLGTEHLLLALLKVNNSICRFVLEEYQVSVEDVEELIKSLIVIRKDDVEYTEKFKEIIENSWIVAQEEKSKHIYDEHIVYSMFKTENCVSYYVLLNFIDDLDSLVNDFANIFDIMGEDDNSYLFNLTKEAKQGKLNKFIGRKGLIDKVIRVLEKKQKNNPLLIGSAGVGKSSLVEGLAIEFYNNYPKITLYRLDLGTIIAGTKYRGDLEERLIKVIEKIKNPNTIVFIDEIHNIMSTGSSEGTLDIANILKPVLARSEIKCIGATTIDEYYATIAKDKALSRRFHTVFIDEPSEMETVQILSGIKDDYQSFYGVKYSDDVIEYIVYRASMIVNRYFPDKAIDILDESGLYCKKLKQKKVSFDMVDKIAFDLLGIDYNTVLKNIENIKYYPELKKYYQYYLMNVFDRKYILSVQTANEDITNMLLEDLKSIFGFKNEMILKIELSKYKDQHSVSNLLGSPKGYVGYESGGILTEHVLKYPFNIIILKRYDLCNYEIKNIIDSIIEEGKIIDAKGRNISFKNTVIIFESESDNKNIGFIEVESKSLVNKKIEEYLDYKHDEIIYYDSLKMILKKLKRFNYFIEEPLDKDIKKNEFDDIILQLKNIENIEKNIKYQLIKEDQNYEIIKK